MNNKEKLIQATGGNVLKSSNPLMPVISESTRDQKTLPSGFNVYPCIIKTTVLFIEKMRNVISKITLGNNAMLFQW